MNLAQFKPFKNYSFYDDSIYNQIFENVTPCKTRPCCIMYASDCHCYVLMSRSVFCVVLVVQIILIYTHPSFVVFLGKTRPAYNSTAKLKQNVKWNGSVNTLTGA